MHRRTLLLTALAALPLALLGRAARAASGKIYSEGGVAIDGTDPVSYFTEGRPVPGDPAITSDWMGTTWRFASAESRAAFEADPAAYAPQYGGYCAYAASKGAAAPTVPEAWTIHDGRLYLNFSTDVRTIWSQDIPGNIALADAKWPDVAAGL